MESIDILNLSASARKPRNRLQMDIEKDQTIQYIKSFYEKNVFTLIQLLFHMSRVQRVKRKKEKLNDDEACDTDSEAEEEHVELVSQSYIDLYVQTNNSPVHRF